MAPADFPDGDAALLFCLLFLFEFVKGSGMRQAFEVANTQVKGEDRFEFFLSPLAGREA